ncbi:MAG: immunoglobulin domain-containing protein [Limisphaerales bacterium]
MKTNWWVWILFLAVRMSAQTITTQPANQIVLFGSNATFSVAVSGTGPFSYQWQFNGTNIPNNTISTVAGNGVLGFYGDNGAATNAGLSPFNVSVDAFDNIFIADSSNNRIRKVNTNGIISTVAGNGTNGFSGDGAAATNATLGTPYSVAVDGLGNLFIADQSNVRVRKIDTNGIITTVAGNGSAFYSGDGGWATNAGVYPVSVAVDVKGNLFIADYINGRIRKVNTNGIISTVAGNGTNGYSGDGGWAIYAKLNFPMGVVVDAHGNLFIADSFNNRIRKVFANGIITTVAGIGYAGDCPACEGGLAVNAFLNQPTCVSVSTLGEIFITDSANCRIRKVDTNGIMTTVAGNGPNNGINCCFADGVAATNSGLFYPHGAVLDAVGNLFISDSGNNRVREVNFAGSPELTVKNATDINGGDYSVIISGAQGSVTSSVAKLVVTISPSFTSQPQTITVTNGYPASFLVAAAGSPPLNYQWFFNGTNLLAFTNTIFTLQNVFPANVGAYSIVVTNAYGSITSNPAMLTVLPLGITAPAILASGQFQFSFETATGVNYTAQYSTNLTQWFPFVTLGGIGAPLTLTDPNTAGSQQRFYRIVVSPQ